MVNKRSFKELNLIGFIVYTTITIVLTIKSIFDYDSFYWGNPIMVGLLSGIVLCYWFIELNFKLKVKRDNGK